MTSVVFFAEGIPTTQGSYRALISRITGKPVMVPMMTSAMKNWRRTMSKTARAVVGSAEPFAGPVRVRATFVLQRPKRPTNPWPRGDADKLARCCGDALRGIAYVDDAQICVWEIAKVYGAPTGVQVEVTPL